MKFITLFLMIVQSGASYTVKQVPIMMLPEMSCYTGLENNTIINELPYGVRYRGKEVFAYYCKNTLTGKFFP